MQSRHRAQLPQLSGDLFLTDGGLETTMVFDREIELPEFAAFDLLARPDGVEELRNYYGRYIELAMRHGAGFLLESPTWRASARWGERIGYDTEALEALNREAISLMAELRDRTEADEAWGGQPIVISACVGPHDDGYNPTEILSAERAADYHSAQVRTFAETEADMISAMTLTYADEAIGVARAATAAGMPVAISYTVETDGRLPSGQALGEAIEEADGDGDSEIAYFMINCAHPTHFEQVLGGGSGNGWRQRIRGIRANASTMSHAELDEAEELDDGDPADLGARYAGLREQLPAINVVGGCCGTDHRHIEAIGKAWQG